MKPLMKNKQIQLKKKIELIKKRENELDSLNSIINFVPIETFSKLKDSLIRIFDIFTH